MCLKLKAIKKHLNLNAFIFSLALRIVLIFFYDHIFTLFGHYLGVTSAMIYFLSYINGIKVNSQIM